MNNTRIVFGCSRSNAAVEEDGIAFGLAPPVLGEPAEFSFVGPKTELVHEEAGCFIHDSGDLVIGFLRGASGKKLDACASDLYERMFGYVGNRFLYRMWHLLPNINAWDTELENYRLFCRGRAEAFNRILGEDCHRRMPAASTVGGQRGTDPVMLFVAGRAEPRHAENPEQVPAYQYPSVYGPRSPSFARATRVPVGEGEVIFISGTASIKGSETIHPHDCAKQLETTLHNLLLIGETAGGGPDLGRSMGASRRFVIYLRKREDFPRVDEFLRDRLFAPADERVFLLADICRVDLMVEIEATVFIPAQSAPPL